MLTQKQTVDVKVPQIIFTEKNQLAIPNCAQLDQKRARSRRGR